MKGWQEGQMELWSADAGTLLLLLSIYDIRSSAFKLRFQIPTFQFGVKLHLAQEFTFNLTLMNLDLKFGLGLD